MAHVLLLLAAVVAVWTALALPLGVLVGRRLRRIADTSDTTDRADTADCAGRADRADPAPGGPGAPPVGRGPVRRRAAGRSRGV